MISSTLISQKEGHMFRLISGCKPVFIGMTVLAFLMAVPLDHSLAALVDTQAAGSEQSADAVRARILALLAHSEIRATLLQHGINPAEAEARVLAMTDQELSQLIESAGAMPAGAGGAIVVFPLAIVILILVGYVLVLTGIISLGAYAGVKVKEYQEEEYAKTTPFSAPPRTGPVVSFNPDEPWTGIWKVTEGRVSGVYAFKQAGNIVTSTPESDHKAETRVLGAMIVGTADSVSPNRPPSSSFHAIIADDYQSFKGTIHQTNFTCERVESKAAAQSMDARAASKTPGPWSGKWSVQGAPYAAGVWVLKQEGDTVVSTGESYHRVSGKALGDRVEGDVLRPFGTGGDLKVNLVLSADGKTFKGDLAGKQGAWQITGARAD